MLASTLGGARAERSAHLSQVVATEQNFRSAMQISQPHFFVLFAQHLNLLRACPISLAIMQLNIVYTKRPQNIRHVEFTSLINLMGGYGGSSNGWVSRMGCAEHKGERGGTRERRGEVVRTLSTLSNSVPDQFKLSEANMAEYK